jgi:hypothetical protein
VIGDDGTVTVHAMMPSALQLFAEGRLPRMGGDPVDNYRHDVAVLVFKPASTGATT